MWLLLIVVLIIVALGGLPQVSGNFHNLGWGPSGLGLALVLVLVFLLLTGRL